MQNKMTANDFRAFLAWLAATKGEAYALTAKKRFEAQALVVGEIPAALHLFKAEGYSPRR